MSVSVNPLFLKDLQKYGAFDINACFNCGNCTAVCPLSKDNDSFPRKMIRYSQIGAQKKLLSCKELWLCYYCGDCSDTCPRQAEPGEFMASARRFAIASLDPTGLSKMLYTSKLFSVFFLAVISVLFSFVFISMSGSMELARPELFEYLSFDLIHDVGIAVIVLAFLAGFAGVIRMFKKISGTPVPEQAGEGEKKEKIGLFKKYYPAFKSVITEFIVESRYRDCEEENPDDPWYKKYRWFIHWSIMWGFIGLLIATGLDYIWLMFGDKIPGQPDPLWWPNRIIGNISGILLMFGTSYAIILRFKKSDKYSSHSLLSDWLFIWLLFFTGLTGFVVEIAVYLPEGSSWQYIMFLVHVVLGMDIVFLLPFTKFAHALYRPLALFIYGAKQA